MLWALAFGTFETRTQFFLQHSSVMLITQMLKIAAARHSQDADFASCAKAIPAGSNRAPPSFHPGSVERPWRERSLGTRRQQLISLPGGHLDMAVMA